MAASSKGLAFGSNHVHESFLEEAALSHYQTEYLGNRQGAARTCCYLANPAGQGGERLGFRGELRATRGSELLGFSPVGAMWRASGGSGGAQARPRACSFFAA